MTTLRIAAVQASYVLMDQDDGSWAEWGKMPGTPVEAG
jgi:3-mercaptopyruvate sulfurtransferase SseA